MEDYNVAVTNEADKGSSPWDMGKAVTVGLDKRWRYNVDFEHLPEVAMAIDRKGGEWVLEDAWPHEARVNIAVTVELKLDVCRPGDRR